MRKESLQFQDLPSYNNQDCSIGRRQVHRTMEQNRKLEIDPHIYAQMIFDTQTKEIK